MEDILKALLVIVYWCLSPSLSNSNTEENLEDLSWWQILIGVIFIACFGFAIYLAFFHPETILNSWFSPFHKD